MTSLPPSIGFSLTNLTQLTLEGCTALEDVSFLKVAKYQWVNLISLHILESSQSNVVAVLSDHNREPSTAEEVGVGVKDYFPSLQYLTLRRCAVTGTDLGRLWSFFQRCPQLTTVDVRQNDVETLQHLAAAATSGSIDDNRHSSLRRLHIAWNPVMMKETVTLVTSPDSDAVRFQTQYKEISPKEEQYMMQILSVCPRLDCIHECEGPRPMAFNRHCLLDSYLYSPKLQHALDINFTSRGKMLLSKDKTDFPLSVWPLVLERAAKVRRVSQQIEEKRNLDPLCQKCGGEDGSLFVGREASVLFSLLKGPVFATREMTCNESRNKII
jgi:hypothetical protein